MPFIKIQFPNVVGLNVSLVRIVNTIGLALCGFLYHHEVNSTRVLAIYDTPFVRTFGYQFNLFRFVLKSLFSFGILHSYVSNLQMGVLRIWKSVL